MSSDEIVAKLGDLALDQSAKGVQYRPLEGSEIRLLSVLPGKWDDQVTCKLYYEPLDYDPEYIALSYTWGDPNDQVEILLDGRPHRVTRSLFTALRRFRQLSAEERSFDDGDFTFSYYPEGSIYIWADALCINQADDVEKMREIPRMREIYTYCTRVCVWLGENDDEIRNGDGETSVSIEEIAEWLASDPFGEDLRPNFNRLDDQDNHELQQVIRDQFGTRTEAFLDQWCKLAARPWFSRVWVIQEVALPEEEPILMAGGCLFGFERYTLPCPLIARMQLSRIPRPWTGVVATVRALIKSRIHAQDNPVEIEEETDDRSGAFGRVLGEALLRQGQNPFKATNMHDYLYSMIGLCGGNELLPPELAPNYEKPFPKVCEEYARCIIKATGSVAILARFQNYVWDLPGDEDRPTWVPDFRAPQLPVSVRLSEDMEPSNVSFVGDKYIKVRGFSVGTVVSGHKPLPSQEVTQDHSFSEHLRHHHAFLGEVARRQKITVEEAVSDWLTTRLLNADSLAWTAAPAVEELQELYDHFLQKNEDNPDGSRAGRFEESDTAKMFVSLTKRRLGRDTCTLCSNGTVAEMPGRDWGEEPIPGVDQVVALSGCSQPFYLRGVSMPDGEVAYGTLGFCPSYYGPDELSYTSSDFSLEEWDESDFKHYLLL